MARIATRRTQETGTGRQHAEMGNKGRKKNKRSKFERSPFTDYEHLILPNSE